MFVPALCIAVSWVVGGVNPPVYTAMPLTTRTLLIYPVNPEEPRLNPYVPIAGPEVRPTRYELVSVNVPALPPLIYNVVMPLFLTNATCVHWYTLAVEPVIWVALLVK